MSESDTSPKKYTLSADVEPFVPRCYAAAAAAQSQADGNLQLPKEHTSNDNCEDGGDESSRDSRYLNEYCDEGAEVEAEETDDEDCDPESGEERDFPVVVVTTSDERRHRNAAAGAAAAAAAESTTPTHVDGLDAAAQGEQQFGGCYPESDSHGNYEAYEAKPDPQSGYVAYTDYVVRREYYRPVYSLQQECPTSAPYGGWPMDCHMCVEYDPRYEYGPVWPFHAVAKNDPEYFYVPRYAMSRPRPEARYGYTTYVPVYSHVVPMSVAGEGEAGRQADRPRATVDQEEGGRRRVDRSGLRPEIDEAEGRVAAAAAEPPSSPIASRNEGGSVRRRRGKERKALSFSDVFEASLPLVRGGKQEITSAKGKHSFRKQIVTKDVTEPEFALDASWPDLPGSGRTPSSGTESMPGAVSASGRTFADMLRDRGGVPTDEEENDDEDTMTGGAYVMRRREGKHLKRGALPKRCMRRTEGSSDSDDGEGEPCGSSRAMLGHVRNVGALQTGRVLADVCVPGTGAVKPGSGAVPKRKPGLETAVSNLRGRPKTERATASVENVEEMTMPLWHASFPEQGEGARFEISDTNSKPERKLKLKEKKQKEHELKILQQIYAPKDQKLQLVTRDALQKMQGTGFGTGIKTHIEASQPKAVGNVLVLDEESFPVLGGGAVRTGISKLKERVAKKEVLETDSEWENIEGDREVVQSSGMDSSWVRSTLFKWGQPARSGSAAAPKPLKEEVISRKQERGTGQAPPEVKMKKKPKRKDPISFNLFNALEVQQQKKSKKRDMERVVQGSKIKKQPEPARFSGKTFVDAAGNVRHKGKRREGPRKFKPTRMKRIILAERLMRRLQLEQQVETATGEKKEDAESGLVVVPSDSGSLELAAESDGEEHVQIVTFGALGPKKVVTMKSLVHSRKFRDYCDHALSKDLDHIVASLLEDVVRFQERTYLRNPIKAVSKPRLVVGLREVFRYLQAKRLKLVIFAPDLEAVRSKGGLDNLIELIKVEASRQDIPYVFSMSRRQLGKLTHKGVLGSSVGIFSFQGSEDNYMKMTEMLPGLRAKYQEMMREAQMLVGASKSDELPADEPSTSSLPETCCENWAGASGTEEAAAASHETGLGERKVTDSFLEKLKEGMEGSSGAFEEAA